MERVRRQRLSAQARRAVVARHSESGLSVKAFCEREAISPASFYQWRSKFGDTSDAAPSPPGAGSSMMKTAGFVDLGTLSASTSRLEVRLDLPRVSGYLPPR